MLDFERVGQVTERAPRNGSGEGTGARLQGRLRLLWRSVSTAVLVVSSVLLLVALPARHLELVETFENLSPAQELVLKNLGISSTLGVGRWLALEYTVIVAFLAVALLIFLRRPDDWVATLVAVGLVTFVGWVSPPLDALAARSGVLWLPVTLVQVLGHACATGFFLVFPDGCFVPRWSRWLVPVLLASGAAWVLFPASLFNLSHPLRLPLASFGVIVGWRAIGAVALVYRYVRVASAEQRQQMKWVLFGVSAAVVSYLTFGFDRFVLPVFEEARMAGIVYELVGGPIFLVSMLVIPLSFGLAVLKYRLYGIDVILSRTMVYGPLTAILAGTYIAAIGLSQRLFVAFTGQKSDAAIVLTTLVVASAFTPVRTRLQMFVDAHFKELSDPTEGMKAISAQIRSVIEVMELEVLIGKVLDEAVGAFDATGGAVYLRRDGGFQPAHTVGDWNQVEGMTAWLERDGVSLGWIALGPRRNLAGYSTRDQAALDELAALLERALQVVGATLPGGSPRWLP